MNDTHEKIEVPTGLLLPFEDPHSMAAGATVAMAFFQDIKPQPASDAISLEVDIQHQAKLDDAWEAETKMDPVEPGENLFLEHEGEVYINRRPDFGHPIFATRSY